MSTMTMTTADVATDDGVMDIELIDRSGARSPPSTMAEVLLEYEAATLGTDRAWRSAPLGELQSGVAPLPHAARIASSVSDLAPFSAQPAPGGQLNDDLRQLLQASLSCARCVQMRAILVETPKSVS